MPEQPQKPQDQKKQVTPQKQPAPEKGKTPAPEQSPTPQKTPPKKKTPAEVKDDRFKYEMTYANGGFNNGAEVKPDKDGKANVEISIYGGGQKKSLSVGPLPPNIEKLVKAYELSADKNEDSPEITQELQKYFAQAKTLLNAKIIDILKKTDLQIANAVKETFTQINKDKG